MTELCEASPSGRFFDTLLPAGLMPAGIFFFFFFKTLFLFFLSFMTKLICILFLG